MIFDGKSPIAKDIFDEFPFFGGKDHARMHAVIREIDGDGISWICRGMNSPAAADEWDEDQRKKRRQKDGRSRRAISPVRANHPPIGENPFIAANLLRHHFSSTVQ